MNSRSISAMTLTELLVATAMVGIVLLGMASVDYAIRQSQVTTSRSTQLAMRVGASMLYVTKYAAMSVGDSINPGIAIAGGGSGDTNYACFRRDAGSDPARNTDDIWSCFTHRSNNTIYFCESAAGGAPLACSAGTTPIGTASSFNVTYVTNEGALNNYVEATITSLYDNSIAVNAFNNPSYTLTSRVNPTGHSG